MAGSVELFSWKPKIEISHLNLLASLLRYLEYYQTKDVQLAGFNGGKAAIHQKQGWSLVCRSGRQSKVKTDKVSFHPVGHASAHSSTLCFF